MKNYISKFLLFNIILFLIIGCGGYVQPKIITYAQTGDLNKIKREIKRGIPIDKIVQGNTALINAVNYNNYNIVKYLVENGANINFTNNGKATPLYFALLRDDIKIIKYLMKNGAIIHEVMIKHIIGNTSLDNFLYFVKESKPTDIYKKYGVQGLSNAINSNNMDFIKHLIGKGVDVNSSTKKTYMSNNWSISNNVLTTQLEWSLNAPELDIFYYLLEQGANINALYSDKKTTILEHLKNSKDKKYIDIATKIIQKRKEKQLIEISQAKENKVNSFIQNNNLQGLKEYTDKNPNAVYYIKDDFIRLALTGPQSMKVGDIIKLLKNGTSEVIAISLIKRVKTPYKEFTIQEIKSLQSMGLSDKVIASMIDVTTLLLRDEKLKKQQEFFLKEQKRSKEERVKERVVYKEIKSQKVNSQGDPIVEKIQDEVIKQGVNKLLNQFF